MDNSFNVECFLRSLRATKPPWECPKCKKIYKSYSGIEYHLLNFDHTAPAHPVNKPTPISRKSKLKFTIKKKSNRFNQRPGSPIEFKSPARDTLTWAEAQRMVEVESEGKIYRLNITDKLDIISDSDVEKDEESLSSKNPVSEKPESEINSKPKPSKKTFKVEKTVSTPNGNDSTSKKSAKDTTSSQHENGNKSTAIPTVHKLPKPSFRLLSDYDKETADAPVRPSAYYRYIEKPLEDLEEEVEYDMDEEDAVWLELMNEHRSKDGLTHVTHNQLELLMDRFEKESYFEQAKNGPGSQGTQPLIDEDAVCCVCNDGECQNSNVILFCDMCNLAVHQECYGVPYIPEGQWLCRRCLQSPSCPVDCCLCPSKSGAFKQTDDGRWSHVVCALWVPEVGFGNTVFLEPIDGLKNVPQARWRLTCYVCKQRNVGACIQCHRTNCYIAFHVTCAQQAGLYMKMEPVRESGRNGVTITVKKEAYCDAHTPLDASPRQNRNKGQFVFEADDKKSSDKLKKTRKILAEKRQEMPHIAIPYIPKDKISSIGRHLSIQKKGSFLQRLLSYWTLKRQSRNGVPLLRRLQSHVHAHKPRDPEAESQQQHLMEQLKYWHRLRHDLERARLLIELLRKREKLKREAVRISQTVSEMQLTPFILLLRQVLDNLRAVDVAKVFAEPVKQKDAPDYYKIVKQPMDFSTMATKIENHKYKTLEDFEEDFNLVVKNCLFYNSRDTIYYRLGMKMRDHGGAVLREAKREVERCGFDAETGMLLVKTPEKKAIEVFNEKTRLKLPLQEQLEVMYGRLDQAILKSRKTRKIRTEISSLKRRMLHKTENKETTPGKHSLSNSKEASARRFSADDVDTSNAANESEAVVSDVGSSSKVSPKIRPVPMKRPVAGRKRLWSARASLENLSEPVTKKGHLERSESCPVDNDITPIDTLFLGEKLSPLKYDGLPKTTDRSSFAPDPTEDHHVDSPIQTPEKSNSTFQPSSPCSNSSSVNRRSAVLFKKKPRDLAPNSNLSGTDTPPEINDNFKANSSNSTPTTCSIKPSCSPSRQSGSEIDINGMTSDLAEDNKKSEDLVNGFNESEDDSIFKGRKTLKRHESFRSYRDDTVGRHSSSDSDSASSRESATRHYRKKRSQKKRRRHSYSAGYMDKNPYQSDGATSETSNDDQPCLILGDIAATQKELFRKQSYVSTTEDELEDDELPSVKPLDLVWAKYRGYPPYPALLIDPKMPRSGFCHNGVPIPVPPMDVLQIGDKRVENGNHRIYLVLFFDTKRTWQWLPRNKLEPLGLDTTSDQAKLSEGRRPALRKNVEAAFKRALLHRSRVTGEIPDSDDEIINEPVRTDSDNID